MPLSRRWTLTRYLIEERRRFPDASGQLNALLLDVSLACKAIARIVAFGELVTTIEQSAAAPPAAGAPSTCRARCRSGSTSSATRSSCG